MRRLADKNVIDFVIGKRKARRRHNPGEERRVIVVDLKDNNGAIIVVPFELKSAKNQSYEINRMISVYGKNDRETKAPKYEWFDNQLNAGNLLYANKKRPSTKFFREALLGPYPKKKSITFSLLIM